MGSIRKEAADYASMNHDIRVGLMRCQTGYNSQLVYGIKLFICMQRKTTLAKIPYVFPLIQSLDDISNCSTLRIHAERVKREWKRVNHDQIKRHNHLKMV